MRGGGGAAEVEGLGGGGEGERGGVLGLCSFIWYLGWIWGALSSSNVSKFDIFSEKNSRIFHGRTDKKE